MRAGQKKNPTTIKSALTVTSLDTMLKTIIYQTNAAKQAGLSKKIKLEAQTEAETEENIAIK